MPTDRPTIRLLARQLGLSRTTVSDALRGCGRVSASTAERVHHAAKLLDYQINPLTGSMMSAMRRASSRSFRGTMAIVDLDEPDRLPHGPFHGEITAGVRSGAAALGFAVEEFVAGPETLPLPRLDSVLQSRGIEGVVILPSWYPPDLSGLGWSRLAGIYTDYALATPTLHSVSADHYHLMMTALKLMHARGYHRLGYVVQAGRDRRIEHRQTAAFRAFQANHPDLEPIAPLILYEGTNHREEFMAWFRHVEPDLVLAHHHQTMAWMEACGARVPETHGFVVMNIIGCTRPCAGMDLQGRVIGARAAEMLAGQIMRNERGLPEWPSRIAIESRWVEGPTVRPARS